MSKPKKKLINISEKTFFQVAALLAALMLLAILMTCLLPKGEFGTLPDGSPDYLSYQRRDDLGGIPLWQGLLAPVLVFFSQDGLTLLMLSLFLLVISAAFQVMNDVGGIRSLIGAVSQRFRARRGLLLVIVSFLFYCFGSFLGLFEEMLTMFPVVASLCVLLGYDSFTGFLCTILACGFGFASAITNPFTVLLASGIIGVNPMAKIWFRVLVFALMFPLLMLFLFRYVRRLERDPLSGVTRRHDEALREGAEDAETEAQADGTGRVRRTYTVFLLGALALIIVSSLLEAVRDYSVVLLIVYFLFGGLAAGRLAAGKLRPVLKSFCGGLVSVLPTIVFVAMAASIKYIFDRGAILPTIVHQINVLAEGRSPFPIALIIYLIVLVLEFFISSSTAKAILVMGLLAVVNVGLSKSMMVLLYTFADGYTNVLFPTSPVLLISLSMIEVDYFTWIRKSLPLFLANFLLVLLLIGFGVAIGY
ncbi:MAG: hypothetical protein IIU18_04795 [Oscillospiraceae bacterium]|nr:hypothetical protein [Oscillospiraceae bacterium]